MMAAVETSEARGRALPGGLRRLGPRVQAFRAWWTRSLASGLPERVRDLLGWIPQRVLVRRAAGDVRLEMMRGDAVREMGAIPLSAVHASGADPLAGVLAPRVVDVPRWLLLPHGAALRRTMTLPAAAAERLRDVLAFEIDRQTPFAQAEVRHDARMLARRGDGQVDAELVVVPKAAIDAELEALGSLSATFAGIDVAGADGRPLGVNLLAAAGQGRREDPWRTWNVVLVAVAIAAVVAGMWQMLANRRAAAELFAQQVEQEAQRARGASIEQRRLLDLVEGMKFLQDTRAARPTTVEVVDELTRRLPDSTYLDKLSIEGDRILLIGLSGEASALVKQLEGSKLWRDAALAGALQPDPRTRKDRFTLTAQLVVAGGSAEATDAR